MDYKDIEKFYKEAYPRKVKRMTVILNGDCFAAEDIVQEAFCRALKYCHIYNENKSTLEVWFNSILFHVLFDWKRAEKHTSVNQNMLSPQDSLEYNKLRENPEFRILVLKEINLVKNETHKKILRLFFIFGYSSKEISEMGLGISQTNVTTVVNRFKESLAM